MLCCASIAIAQPLPFGVAAVVNAIERDFPGARCVEDRGKVAAVLGVPMKTTGRTPEEAVEAWLTFHGGAFGEPPPDIEVLGSVRLLPKGNMERAVVRGAQWMEGRRVSGAVIRALCVRSEGTWAPVYIAMNIADEPPGGLGEPARAGPGSTIQNKQPQGTQNKLYRKMHRTALTPSFHPIFFPSSYVRPA